MNRDSILDKFHADVRMNAIAEPGYEVVREPRVLRLVSLNKSTPFNMVLCSDLNDENADYIIEREISYFRKRNEPFEWKLFSYDKPEDLGDRLRDHGLKEADEESLMVAAIEDFSYEVALSPSVTLFEITDGMKLSSHLQAVYEDENNPEHQAALLQNLIAHLQEAQDTIAIFGANYAGKPASIGWAFFPPHSRFSGLFGGTTHSRYRGKGFYKALIHARAEAARKKGFQYLFVDAGPMSQPILQKLNFKELAKMQGFHWSPY